MSLFASSTAEQSLTLPPAPKAAEHNFDLGEIFGASFPELQVKGNLQIPPYAFMPDQWTKAFCKGLQKADLKDAVVGEVGVGTGAVSIYLLATRPEIAKIYGADIDGRLTKLAEENVTNLLNGDGHKFSPHHGNHSLLDWVTETKVKFDAFIACIPQMKRPDPSIINGQADVFAHYYDPACVPASTYNRYDLGLNHNFLRQAQEHLPEGGKVIVNLAGRPSLKVLFELFTDTGFVPRVIHEEIIPQHSGTRLTEMVEDERNSAKLGKPIFFEFFADAEATKRISAAEAHSLLCGGDEVFHKIYVIEGLKPEKYV